jgi:hypothetical protein
MFIIVLFLFLMCAVMLCLEIALAPSFFDLLFIARQRLLIIIKIIIIIMIIYLNC